MANPDQITCPHCQANLELDATQRAEWAGQTVECPGCGQTFDLPASEPAANRPRIELRRTSPAGLSGTPAPAANGETPCPSCGAVVAADALICVGCGTNLKTGEKLETSLGAARPGGPTSRRRLARTAVGVVAVAVIIGSLASLYLRWRDEQVTQQTLQIGSLVWRARNSHDFAASIRLLEGEAPGLRWATNQVAVAETLAWCRTELAQVPARSSRLAQELDRAGATNLEVGITILRAALAQCPGATNETAAAQTLQRYEREFAARGRGNR